MPHICQVVKYLVILNICLPDIGMWMDIVNLCVPEGLKE